MRLRWAFWFVLAGLFVLGSVVPYWLELDNHSYLIMYWCLAFGIALLTNDRTRTLATTARLVTGLVFLFAFLWKVTTPEFPSGAFFEFTLLTDERFRSVAELIGGLPAGAIEHNMGAPDQWWSSGGVPEPVRLESGARIPALSQAITYWTLLIEGLIAALFLLPRGKVTSRVGEVALLAFIATTYGLAPVVGFGWVLLLLGLAQTSFTPRVAHCLYPAVFIGLQAASLSDDLWSAVNPLPL